MSECERVSERARARARERERQRERERARERASERERAREREGGGREREREREREMCSKILICIHPYVVCVCIPRIISWNRSLSNSAFEVRYLPESLKRQCASISDTRNYHKKDFAESLPCHFR